MSLSYDASQTFMDIQLMAIISFFIVLTWFKQNKFEREKFNTNKVQRQQQQQSEIKRKWNFSRKLNGHEYILALNLKVLAYVWKIYNQIDHEENANTHTQDAALALLSLFICDKLSICGDGKVDVLLRV